MKTRNQHNKHRSKFIIKFYSQKNSSHIWCESHLERCHALTLEFNDNVECYTSQPGSISVRGKRYTPDFLVVYFNQQPEFHEVKHSGIIQKTPDFYTNFSLRRTELMQLSQYDLKLFTEKDVHSQHVTTLDALYRFRTVDLKHINELDNLPERTSLGELINWLHESELGTHVDAWALIAQKHYSLDNFKEIDNQSNLTRISSGTH